MSSSSSVTHWIDQLKTGDTLAAQRLWEVYFQRMVEVARRKLEGAPRAAADEEDVALSAFKSFCQGARQGRFTQLLDGDNLWPLLMAITLHKSVDLIRGENRQKRGGTGRAHDPAPPSDLQEAARPGNAPREPWSAVALSELLSREPNPEFTVELADQLQRLLEHLDATGDADLRPIALFKMQGYKTGEIAARIGCAGRTVERKLQLIARLWERDIGT